MTRRLPEFSGGRSAARSGRGYWVYMLRCSDGSIYTGYTVDLRRRLASHNAGRGSKYTRSRLPVELVFSEKAPSLNRALKREFEIKRLSRREKLLLCSAVWRVSENSSR